VDSIEVGDIVEFHGTGSRYEVRAVGRGSWTGERYYECSRHPRGRATGGKSIFYDGQVSLVRKGQRPAKAQK
jgi:hypothetical protein